MWEVKRLPTIEWKPMDYLEGTKVTAVRIPHVEYLPDGDVTIVKDYPKAILVDMEYRKTHGWAAREPRHIRILVAKASLYCGDVVLKQNGHRIRSEIA